MIFIKRSCNSNIRVSDDCISFNAFSIRLDGINWQAFCIAKRELEIQRAHWGNNEPASNVEVLKFMLDYASLDFVDDEEFKGDDQ